MSLISPKTCARVLDAIARDEPRDYDQIGARMGGGLTRHSLKAAVAQLIEEGSVRRCGGAYLNPLFLREQGAVSASPLSARVRRYV